MYSDICETTNSKKRKSLSSFWITNTTVSQRVGKPKLKQGTIREASNNHEEPAHSENLTIRKAASCLQLFIDIYHNHSMGQKK